MEKHILVRKFSMTCAKNTLVLIVPSRQGKEYNFARKRLILQVKEQSHLGQNEEKQPGSW